MSDVHAGALADDHRRALADAVAALENPNLAARIADYAGAPLSRVLALLPRRADALLTRAVERAMMTSLKAAIGTLEGKAPRKRAELLSSMAVGVTGGVSGFVGLAALPIELPVTTTLMLRSIAEIARGKGENLSLMESRLACLQVFALGARRDGALRGDMGYFAARAMLTKITGEAATYLVERSAAELSAPVVGKFLSELVSRFSIVVSDRIASSSLPVIGAIGGATVNMIFMNHFQQVAKGHFTVRSLERHYGAQTVRRHYAEIATGLQRAA